MISTAIRGMDPDDGQRRSVDHDGSLLGLGSSPVEDPSMADTLGTEVPMAGRRGQRSRGTRLVVSVTLATLLLMPLPAAAQDGPTFHQRMDFLLEEHGYPTAVTEPTFRQHMDFLLEEHGYPVGPNGTS